MNRLIVNQTSPTNPTAGAKVAPQLPKFIRITGLSSVAAVPVKSASGGPRDYRDVRIAGYLSTFVDTTPADRQGDYVLPGAFAATIPDFMHRNPVLLVDHVNQCRMEAGRFDILYEDTVGLRFVASISNAPSLVHVRFQVVEGNLRGISMGGMFHYGSDGHAITKVDLYEGSLVPIPANPDALFSRIA